MDGTAPAATPNDLYKRIGTASAPLLIDVCQQNAFKANDRLIIGASNSSPADFDVAWNTCPRVEHLVGSLGPNPRPLHLDASGVLSGRGLTPEQYETALATNDEQETTMGTLTTSFLLAICTVAVWVAPTHAQNAETTVVQLPQDIVYKGLPGAPQHVTLFGDSSQPGLYVDRIKFQPGMKVMPHWHPDTARTVLVMSGTFYFAVGEQWDESKLKAYPAGTLYSEPARTPHYAWAKDGEVVLQVTAIGPTGNVPISQKQP
jgi:quercetin dioxygenase-like cupin family protein